MLEWHDVRQGRGNRVYESKGLPGAAAMVARYGVRLVRQGDTAAFSQRFAGGLLQCWKGMTCGKGMESRLCNRGFAGMLRLKRGFEDR